MTTQPDKLVVSQEDRDLVFSLMSPCARNEVEVLALQYIRDGMGDDAEAVQEVARHRQRAMNQAADERQEMCAKVAVECGNFGDYTYDELTSDFGQPRFEMMREIVAAIRSIGKGGV